MKEIREYTKDEMWKNRKTGEVEPIPEMSVKKLTFKLRLLQAKVDDHKRQIDRLQKMRKVILHNIVQKGDKPKSKDELTREFIILNGTEKKPIVVLLSTLTANGIDPEECIKQDLIYLLPDTKLSDDL